MNHPPADLRVLCLCAEWCGVCRDYQAVLTQVAREYPAMPLAWVDIEDHAELADAFEVDTFPTLLVVSVQGLHFLGPVLPHARALSRLLGALPEAKPVPPEATALAAAVQAHPALFAVPGLQKHRSQ